MRREILYILLCIVTNYYFDHYRIFVYNTVRVCVSKVYLHIFRFCCVFVYILTLPLDGKGLLFEHRSIETKFYFLKKI